MNIKQTRENFESFWKSYCLNCHSQNCNHCRYRDTIADLSILLDIFETYDLISRDDLIDAHYNACNNDPNKSFYTWSLQLMREAPSAINKEN